MDKLVLLSLALAVACLCCTVAAADAAGEQAKLIANAMRAAAAEEWKKDEAGDQALLETSSTLRGRSGRAALEMKAIEANMQTLRSLHGNKKMMTMEPLKETERKKETTSNSLAELDATAGREDDLELQGALVTDLNSTTKNSDELSKRKEGIEEAMNDARVSANDQPVSHMTMQQVLKHQKSLTKVLSHLMLPTRFP